MPTRQNNIDYSDNKSKSDVELAKDIYVKTPETDIIEKGNEIIVMCDMPGVDKSSVEVEYENNVLLIIGWQKMEEKYDKYEPLHTDYRVGGFKRSFNILTEIDVEKIKANVKDGVLTVTLPKHEKAKPKKIQVLPG